MLACCSFRSSSRWKKNELGEASVKQAVNTLKNAVDSAKVRGMVPRRLSKHLEGLGFRGRCASLLGRRGRAKLPPSLSLCHLIQQLEREVILYVAEGFLS